METRTYKVYTFAELSDDAKANAMQKHEANMGGASWFRADEYLDSIKALAEHFGGKVNDYSIDWPDSSYSSMSFDMPERDEAEQSLTAWRAEIRKKLAALGTYNRRTLKGRGDCKLTGVCTDESAIDGFRWAFYRGGAHTLGEMMNAAYETWFAAAKEDYRYDFGPEGFAEDCEANGYKFDEEGNLD